jgi:beta-xylosidase
LKTAKALTTPVLLWEGWDRRFTEGPHVYKRDGYYYLLVAEGGTFEDHMISIARGDSIHGPFEPCPNNPLLTTKGTDGYLQHVGHGDFFQDAEGSWWTVLLGVVRTGDRYPLGRETFLAKVDWPEKEWPRVHEVEGRGCDSTLKPGLFKDNSFVHLRDADLSTYTIGDRQLVLSASTSDLSSHKDTVSFAGRRQLHLDGSSSVTLCVQQLRSTSVKAGICIYKDEHRFAALGFDSSTSQMYFEARNAATGSWAEARASVHLRDRVNLCIDYTHLEWSFRYRVGESEDWMRLGVVDTLQLSGRDFTGPILGVFAVGSEEDEGHQVRFADVDL